MDNTLPKSRRQTNGAIVTGFIRRNVSYRLARSLDEFYHIFRNFGHVWSKNKFDVIDFESGLGQSSFILYGLVRAMRPAVCVEIGSARGRSACHVGMALCENAKGHLYAIDPHTDTAWNDQNSVRTFDVLQQNLKRVRVADRVSVMRQFSADAAKNWTLPVDILFIDGDHTYEGVRRDWELFLPFMAEFGVVVFHDTMGGLNPPEEWTRDAVMGVPRFVDELRQQGYPVLTFAHDHGTSLVQPRKGGIVLH